MSFYGEKIRLNIFGESHGAAVGAVAEGLPAGFEIDMEELSAFLRRRAPGSGKLVTQRKEADLPDIVTGVLGNKTTGAPLTVLIHNTDTRSRDYQNILRVPRPSHADYPAYVKFGGNNDIRGGGHFSARITAALAAAGGIVLQMLAKKGVFIGAHIAEIGGIRDERFDAVKLDKEELLLPGKKELAVISEEAGEAMKKKIEEAASKKDSVGGVIECAVTGIPAGLGDALFDGIEGRISSAVFGIPAVKGVEFGAGFGVANMLGSENNDPYYFEGESVRTKTNNAGGICGGISTGMPIVFRAAFKPTPSIGIEQDSVDLANNVNTKLVISGRHDPCVVLRAVPIVEAAAALAIADLVL